jgi:hypothetical protein
MTKPKETDFAERLNAAAKAKQAHLEKYRAMLGAKDDPALAQRDAARRAAAEAREKRVLDRKAAREAAAAAEKAAREAAAIAEQRAREQAIVEAAAHKAALEADQKARRDARYAARKERGKKKK